MAQGIAIDIGTSGIRGQLVDLDDGKVIRTCITSRNPIPGSNVMDHMTFAINYGLEAAHGIMISAVKEVIELLSPDSLERMSVCGNPIQLSIFEGIDIRDLAYAGDNKKRSENVPIIERVGHLTKGSKIGLPDVDIVIPPSVRHEIGADALAMMLKSGFLDDDMCMVTDYGTNAEMALKVGDNIYTGSAAAGPAMEGQHIRFGMIAGPGAVSDLERVTTGWRVKVLNDNLVTEDGPIINLRSDQRSNDGTMPTGITGTGVVALIYAALANDRIVDGKIRNGPIKITRKIDFDDTDFHEAGKAIGAIRAGHLTLMLTAGVDPKKIKTMYMAGASGTYVDPVKSKEIGLIIPYCETVKQVGNTSLELAKDILLNPAMIDDLNKLRDKLVTKHVMFASSDIFSELYVQEYAYWSDGMPLRRYRRILINYDAEGYLDEKCEIKNLTSNHRDIVDIGESLKIIDLKNSMTESHECSRCMKCVHGCPEHALELVDDEFVINTGRCLGTACNRCQENCPEKCFDYSRFVLSVNG